MDQPEDGWLPAGRVGRAHGLDGSFYVRDPSPALLRVGVEVRVDEPRDDVAAARVDDLRALVRAEPRHVAVRDGDVDRLVGRCTFLFRDFEDESRPQPLPATGLVAEPEVVADLLGRR